MVQFFELIGTFHFYEFGNLSRGLKLSGSGLPIIDYNQNLLRIAIPGQ
jgi:hypothetical protein